LSHYQDNKHQLYDHLNYLGKIRSRIIEIERQITTKRNTELKSNELRIFQNKLNSDEKYVHNVPGSRQMSEFTFKRLYKMLSGLNYRNDSLNCLLNEIVFEVRFGSLTYKQDSTSELDVDHAVNIAVKLVRERRWKKPTKLSAIGENINNFGLM